MPSPNWRTLLAALVIFTVDAANLQAASTDNTSAYRPISRGEFRNMVLAGKEITGRIVPSSYITNVFEDADNLRK